MHTQLCTRTSTRTRTHIRTQKTTHTHKHTRIHTRAHTKTHTGASWYLLSGHDTDIRGVLALLRAPERAAATACALHLLRMALRPYTTEGSETAARGKATAPGTASTASTAGVPAGSSVAAGKLSQPFRCYV